MIFEKKGRGRALFFLIIGTALTFSPLPAEDSEETVLRYGLDSEITALLGRLATEKRFEYREEVRALFDRGRNGALREAIVGYFIAAADDALVEEAAAALSREEASPALTTAYLRYLAGVKGTAAAGAVRGLVTGAGAEEQSWFDAAVAALGALGDGTDGVFLGELLARTDLSSTRRQVVIKALGDLKAASATGALTALAEDTEAGVALRVQAVEALGAIGDGESVPALLRLYEQPNPYLRAASVKSMAAFGGEAAETLVLQAVRDDQWRVRLEGIAGARALGMQEAAPFLLQRAKSDPEAAVRYAAFEAVAALDFPEGEAYLAGLMADKKLNDTVRARAGAALLGNGKGRDAVAAAARETLGDDKKKQLRYALGKEFAKTGDGGYAEICGEYLASKDVATQGIGLDMWAKGKYAGLADAVRGIAGDEKAGPNRRKAERSLSADYAD